MQWDSNNCRTISCYHRSFGTCMLYLPLCAIYIKVNDKTMKMNVAIGQHKHYI